MRTNYKKYFAIVLILALIPICFSSFIVVHAIDAPAPIGPLPSEKQIAWQELGLTAFVHFGMNTFTGYEWGTGQEDPSWFNPTNFDANQWVSVLKDAGFKMIVLTAKHHDGFCLWPSAYTTHDVASSPWKGGNGDVVREVADACHAAGMKFGIYLSPWDRHEPTYGSGEAYNTFFENQLRELLTNYGEITEVWFDGASDGSVHQEWDIYNWANIVYELQPNAVIFQGNFDIRWAGNENGVADDPCWSIVDANRNPTPYGTKWMPAECDVPIRPGWFYKPWEDTKLKSLSRLAYIYKNSVGINANLLFNVSPDTRGLIPDVDIARLNEFKNYLDTTFGNDLAQGAVATASNSRGAGFEASKVLDDDKSTYWAASDGVTNATLTLNFGTNKTFDMVELQEPIELGERILEYTIDVWNGNSWVTVATKQGVGIKKIIQFQPVTASQVRVNITSARACPAIRTMKVYKEMEQPGCVFYADKNYTGLYEAWDTGYYSMDKVWESSLNDAISSIKIPSGYKVTVGTDDSLGGQVFTFTSSIADLSAISGADNSISSINVEKIDGTEPPPAGEDLCTGGAVYASSENAPHETAAKAFDDNINTKWYAFGSTPWIQYDFDGTNAYAVNKYTITSANDEPGRDPKSWVLKGSSDAIYWTVLDTRTNEVFESRGQKKTYTFNNDTPYTIYMLEITENNGANDTQIAEIEMFEQASQ